MFKRLAAATLVLAFATAPLYAATIVQDVSSTTNSRYQFYFGQSFTTPAGPTWTNISVNFYDRFLAPYAAGTGYIFGAAYAGTPAGLASAAALGSALTGNGTSWDFAPGFTLAPGTQYFFYTDAAMRIAGGGSGAVGGTSVFTQNGTGLYASAGGLNTNFTVSGTAAVPEPASWALMLLGFGLAGATLRRRTPAAV